MSEKVSAILFKEYRRQVLTLLLLDPKKSYHVREIARLTGTIAGTMHKELSRLENAGLLKVEKQGNQLCYRANTDCPIYSELSAILRKLILLEK